MSKFLLTALILTCLCRPSAAADERADARAILEKAIKAKGDEAALDKIVAVHCKLESKYYSNGETTPLRVEMYDQGFDKTRTVITDRQGDYIEIANGKAGWIKDCDKPTKSMSEVQLAATHEGIYLGWIRWLVQLRNTEYRLSPLEDMTVDGRQVVGILVRHEKYDAVKLYFDKETNLLRKSEVRYMDVETGRETHMETIYTDYRAVRGIKQPFKASMFRDGEKRADNVCTLVEPSDRPFDDKLFTKP